MRKYILAVCAFISMSVFLLPAPAWAKDKLVMGVHPYKPITELQNMFKPIADYVSEKLGIPVELQFAKSYEEAAQKIGNGHFDFAFLGPTIYVESKNKFNVQPLAQIINNGSPSFYGVVVVRKDSGIVSMKDLKGKTFAFGDRNSALTHILPLYMLMNAGVHLSDLKYAFVGSHDSVANNVITGSFEAGGLMPDIAAKYMDRGLTIMTKSPEIPEHVFVATKSMDTTMVVKLQKALLEMNPTLYKSIKPTLTGMQKFNDKDFDILRTILKKVEKDLAK